MISGAVLAVRRASAPSRSTTPLARCYYGTDGRRLCSPLELCAWVGLGLAFGLGLGLGLGFEIGLGLGLGLGLGFGLGLG